MSYILTPFEVSSKTLGEPVKIRFVHLLSGIATRHRDSIDCAFLVNGRKVLVAISCATLTHLREQKKTFLTDQQLVEVAAHFLRRNLEDGFDPSLTELFLGGETLLDVARELKFM
ncbi:MAG TPA: hypothetical protein VG028_04400 [Terriglobia bacterium]|nr:hypothetical protein [Terriglobia bacterium]